MLFQVRNSTILLWHQNIPTSLLPPCFTVGIMLFWLKASPCFFHIKHWSLWPKLHFCVETLFEKTSRSPANRLAIFMLVLEYGLLPCVTAFQTMELSGREYFCTWWLQILPQFLYCCLGVQLKVLDLEPVEPFLRSWSCLDFSMVQCQEKVFALSWVPLFLIKWFIEEQNLSKTYITCVKM